MDSWTFDVNKKLKKKSHFLDKIREKKYQRGQFFDQNLPRQKKKKKVSLLFMGVSADKKLADFTPMVEWWDKEWVDQEGYKGLFQEMKGKI